MADSVKLKRDRLSSLPDSLLFHILSFLSTKEAVKTGVLSRRWRNVWTLVSSLKFDELEFRRPWSYEARGKRNSYKIRFLNFVDRVLLLRCSSNLRKFHLSCVPDSVFDNSCCEESRASCWIYYAKRHFVEQVELALDSHPKSHFESLPYPLFTCESLKIMKLIMSSLRLPNSIYLPNLEALQLSKTQISPDGASIQLLISSCPKIENFSMESCDLGTVEIIDFSGCSYLENLTIDECKCKGLKNFVISGHALKRLVLNRFRYLEGCEMKIYTPNLISFNYKGAMFKKFSAQNLSSLFVAVIDSYSCYFVDDSDDNDFGDGAGGGNQHNDSTLQNRITTWVDILKVLQNAKSLTLHSAELFSKSRCLLEIQPLFFPSLKSLRISTRYFDKDFVQVIICILKGSPILETLAIEYMGLDYEAWCWKEVDFPFKRPLSHLKEVEIGGFEGTVCELGFAKFILKNAVVLESIVFISPSMSSESLEGRRKIIQELLKSPRSSLTVAIVFSD